MRPSTVVDTPWAFLATHNGDIAYSACVATPSFSTRFTKVPDAFTQ